MSNQVMAQCAACGKATLHVQPSTSHLLHFFLSVITFGFWAIIWGITAANNASQATCTACGRMRGIFGLGKGGNPPPRAPERAATSEALQAPASPLGAPRASPTKPPPQVMCGGCGNLIDATARFCPSCGAKL